MTDLTPEIPKQTKSPKKSNLGIGLLILLTLVIALTALYMNQKLARTLDKQSKTFDTTLSMLVQQQSSTEARLQAYRAVTASREARAKQARDAFEKKLTATLNEQHHVSDDWRLLKAQYLLELAGLNAHWSTDKNSTLAMLKEADEILTPLHNPALIHVRQAIAHDIQAIAQSPTTDITALMTQLSAALTSTWQLPINPLPKAASPPDATHFLQHLITIRHHSDQLAPKPTLAFEAMLRASIRLNLQEAQWAVLEKNNAIYQQALKQAISHLTQSFVSDATHTKTLIKQLQALQKTTLNTEHILPEKALKALNHVILTTESKPSSGDAS
jgi:uroporphyrin-III C-methyltransferase